MPKLTAAIIVRDSEIMLSRCLDSLREVADEIIVVSSVPTAATPDLQLQDGAKLYQLPETDNASLLFNRALEKSTGDWVLFLLPNELLLEGSRSKLDETMARPYTVAARLPVSRSQRRSSTPDRAWRRSRRQGDPPFHTAKLFRRVPTLQWTGRICPTAAPSLEALEAQGFEVANCPVSVVRYDARPAQAKQRRASLVQRLTPSSPDELQPESACALIEAVSKEGDAAEVSAKAFRVLHRARRSGRSSTIVRAATLVADTMLEEGKPMPALRIIDQTLRNHDHPNLHFLRGHALERCGHIRAARYAFCQAVARRGGTFEVPIAPGACSWGSTTRLGYLAILEGELEAAQANFVTAVKQVGAQPDCISGLIESWLRAGQLEPAVQELEVTLARQTKASPDEITLQALVAELMGDPSDQADRLKEAVAMVGDLREQHRRRLLLDLSCSLALSQGDVELASKLAKSTGGVGAASSVTSSLWGRQLTKNQLSDARVQAIAANLFRYQPVLARTLSRRIPLRQLAACAHKRGARAR